MVKEGTLMVTINDTEKKILQADGCFNIPDGKITSIVC